MELIAEGKYRMRAVEHSQVTENENTHNEEIRVLCEILEEGEFQGRYRTWYGYFTEATAERTIESLRTMGWRGNDITNISLEPDVEFQGVIKHEAGRDDPGKIRDRIAFINRLAGVYVGTPMDEGKKKAFAQRMKGLVLATAPKGGTAAPAASRQTPKSAAPSEMAGAGFPFGQNAPSEQRAGGVKL